MAIQTVIDERRSAKTEWGDAVIKVRFPPANRSHAEKVQAVAQKCLDLLEEAVTGQKPLPLDAPKPDKPVKGQKKLPLGPGGVVETQSDGKEVGEFVPDFVEPGEIAARGEAFVKGGAVARPAIPEPTGPLGEAV